VTSNGQSAGVGISFFIAPYHSKISESSSDGYLDLVSHKTAFNTFQNQIVAVEFNTIQNERDHTFVHVCIYVNSSSSITMVKWGIGSAKNFLTPVVSTVSYDALSHQLNVVVSNVVRNEFLRRFDWLVKGRKVGEHNTVRMNPLKGKVVTSHTHKKNI